MFKMLRPLAFVCVALLVMPALASEVQSAGLTLSSSGLIDSHFEFTEETQAPFTLIITENTVTAVTLAQNRTIESANDNGAQIALTFDSVAKLQTSLKFEVGWQSLNANK